MENKDLGSKKINNEQDVNEGFSGENLPENYNPSDAKLQQELEKKQDGSETIVNRARNVGAGNQQPDKEGNLDRDAHSEAIENTAENRDWNYDLNPERYPKGHPDNHKNRGNIKLDEE